jgi:hypothetical protein
MALPTYTPFVSKEAGWCLGFDSNADRAAFLKTALKNAEVDGMPCVSCGKPSQRHTPDDADMCHECFGDFNAAEYDNLKKQADALASALKTAEAIATAHFSTMKHDDPGKEKYIETVDNLRTALADWNKYKGEG